MRNKGIKKNEIKRKKKKKNQKKKRKTKNKLKKKKNPHISSYNATVEGIQAFNIKT